MPSTLSRQVIYETVLASAIATTGTLVIAAYPSGTNQAYFTSGNAKAAGVAIINDNDVYTEAGSTFAITYGASTITLTNNSGKTWAAGSKLRVGLAYADATEHYSGQISAAITALTDSSGGTASDTIAAQGAAYVQATQQNTIASLTAKINRILAALQKAGITL